MKIGIIGSGAMGSVYGALLADAGNDVWMFDKWAEHVEAMRAHGVRCAGASGDRTVRVNATTHAADAGACELAIVATKVMDIEAALGDARAMIGPETLVLAIQNGLGNVERVTRVLGAENVLFGIAGGFGAELKGPGHVHHNGMEAVNLAELKGGITPRLERVAEVWRGAGFTVNVYDDLWPVVWSKLVANVAFSAICTITGMPVGQVRANEWAWGIARACVEEAVAVAAAKGIRLAYDDPVRWVSDFAAKIPGARPSMYQDVRAGRRSEIDAIQGGVVAEGAKLGVPTPTCAMMVQLVKALEEKALDHGDAYHAL
ncbi:MAG TPA: 2-dehydropantoate 2-reductase [Geminicoccaceae bacterium]|nr:2-dehydropantoate 2-reductase [Geminicoccaceae bacterium]